MKSLGNKYSCPITNYLPTYVTMICALEAVGGCRIRGRNAHDAQQRRLFPGTAMLGALSPW